MFYRPDLTTETHHVVYSCDGPYLCRTKTQTTTTRTKTKFMFSQNLVDDTLTLLEKNNKEEQKRKEEKEKHDIKDQFHSAISVLKKFNNINSYDMTT